MQAPSSGSSYSNICVQFGQVNEGPTEVELLIKLFMNSQKNENIRFNVQEFLNQQIPQGSFLIEIDAAEDGEDLAHKLKEIKENSESMKELETDKQMDIKIVGKGNKVYIVMSGEGTKKIFKNMGEPFKQIKFPAAENSNEHVLEVHLQSNSELKRIHTVVKERGTMMAFFESLKVNFNFPKNQVSHFLLLKFLPLILKQIPNIETLLKTFKSFNLNVKGQSSSVLQNYPDLISSLKFQQDFNDDFKSIQHLLGFKIKAYLFGKPLSFSVSLEAKNLYFILDVLFA